MDIIQNLESCYDYLAGTIYIDKLFFIKIF